MPRRLLPALAALLLSAPLACAQSPSPPTPSAPPPRVTNDQVEDAIKKATDYLLAAQTDGRWEKTYEPSNPYYGGETALILYGLLNAGKGSQDRRLQPQAPELRNAIRFLHELEPKSTYVVALQASALSLLPRKNPPPPAMIKARDLLLYSMQAGTGGYSYYTQDDPKKKTEIYPDTSNTQMAVLGMWGLQDAGVSVPTSYWTTQDAYWRDLQSPTGGWPYRKGQPDSLSMSAAGVATLFIMADVRASVARLDPKPDKNLDAGLAGLAKDYKADNLDPYTLYSIERVGLAGGAKFFGKHDWYQEGAAYLLSKQAKDGSWNLGFHETADPRIVTPFALTFLVRGRHPVVFNKLQYDGPWNARPRDDAHLTARLAEQYEMPLNWQTVSLDVDAQDWTDAPVLLITGHVDPKFTPEQVAKLKQFVQLGGLIFSTTAGNAKEFDDAVQSLMTQIAPPGQTPRELPSNHPVYTIQNKLNGQPKAIALSNGLRELWIHVPEDLSAAWQTNNVKQTAAFDFPANVFFYARGRAPSRNRLQTLAVPEPAAPPVRTIPVARLQYDGNWDPEPGAWQRLTRLAAADFSTKITLATVTLDTLDPAQQRILYVTGSDALKFDEAQTAKLKKFIDAGGVIWADAANSSPAFGNSLVALEKKLLPNAPFAVLPIDHTLFGPYLTDAVEIKSTRPRPYTIETEGRFEQPKILAAKSGAHLAVVFSPHDCLSGFLGTSTWGVSGYMPDSAVSLARNILLYLQAESEALQKTPKK